MEERCFNHPNKKAVAPCHSCGKYFCEECLTEGGEYYYCKDEQCQSLRGDEDHKLEITDKINVKKWKENSRRFYKKSFKILGVVWGLLAVLLFIISPPYTLENLIRFSLLSLITCLKCFVLAWIVRVTIYRTFIWESRLKRGEI